VLAICGRADMARFFDEYGAYLGLILSFVVFGAGVKVRDWWLYRRRKRADSH
jgi:purine-cytosine permease-like protein